MVFNNGASDTNQQRVYQDLQSFFDRYFELYGRDIVLHAYNEQGGTCAQAVSEADGVAAQYRPFAVADDNASPSETCAYAAMARDRVIVGTEQPWFTRANMEAYAPWLWEYPMAPDDVLAGTAAFVCSQLAGRDAVWSPDPLMQSTRRKFGLIYEYDETPFPNDSVGALDRALGRCGVTLADQAVYMDTEDSNADPQEFYTTAVAQMKADGVTTVLTALEGNYEYVPAAADADNYYPEWLRVPTYPFNQFTENVLWPEADQRVGLLGLWDEPDHVPYDEATLNWALQAVDPGFQEDYNYVEYEIYQQLYWSLLLIASGIQMAGPDLTPGSFQRGLELTRFPNPPSPEQEGAAGFDQGSHAMTEDFAAMWYSNSAPNPYPDANGTGAWCYADGGRRFTPATWGALVGYHQGPCDSSPPGS